MLSQTELASWMFPAALKVAEPPILGQKAPTSQKLQVPGPNGSPVMVTFLRHCGCPFAEKTFLSLRTAAAEHPAIRLVAVSHSDAESTEHWLQALGGLGHVEVIVDLERESYAAWGLGASRFLHILNPWSMYSVYKFRKEEGIWNRPTESGTRCQSSGTFATDGEEVVGWAKPARAADEVPDLAEALEALKMK
ncbi:hypothetical protein BCR34DRAFT_493908 [Clohesyomyces aquaticus]|uniref:Thioredoxin domain-containing protein n=1 Tax=Clohesyomyces aquaticus TaxID=1231657 RepID=A0A1Y1YTG5_9PLEO|nr:hypothetical protein BCR34DRAFT_493908 [Clohesyomyces aquaticus]